MQSFCALKSRFEWAHTAQKFLPWPVATPKPVKIGGPLPLDVPWVVACMAKSSTGRRSQACIVLGAAVVVLAPEKYNSNSQWPC